jgi:NAD(P)H dehydrogenase (quinone)
MFMIKPRIILTAQLEDHKQDAFAVGAPTTDVFYQTGRSAEDFETIARRSAAQPENQRTLSNWLREFAQFMIAPLIPGFNFDRHDRELRRPLPSAPRFSVESVVWRDEHNITEATSASDPSRNKTIPFMRRKA